MPATEITKRDNQLTDRLRGWSEPLPLPEDPAFADAFEVFGSARVVLLGEASYGGPSSIAPRAAITRRLIERHGFTTVAVKGDWPDAAQFDAYVRQRQAPPLPEPL